MRMANLDQQIFLDRLYVVEKFQKRFPPIAQAQRAELKASMKEHGQEVCATVVKNGHGYDMIDGYHRWQIAAELGWKHLRCDIVSGLQWQEMTEQQQLDYLDRLNKHRRHLETFTEKVEAFKSTKRRGRGQPKKNSPDSGEYDTPLSADEAAKQSGFTSPQRALEDQAIYDATVPEVHKALDQDKITKEQAKALAKLPRIEQRPALRQAKLDHANKQERDKPLVDAAGKEVPEKLRRFFAVAPLFTAVTENLQARIQENALQIAEAFYATRDPKKTPRDGFHCWQITNMMAQLCRHFESNEPVRVCTCGGDGCKKCHDRGYLVRRP